jgi:hypothetical protein
MPARRPPDDGPTLGGLWRDAATAVSRRELKRLWQHDASRAFDVLTRDQRVDPGPVRNPLRRLLHRARLVLIGVSSRLSRGRRAVFAFSIVTAVLGTLNIHWVIHQGSKGGTQLTVESSPFLFVLAYGSLLFLLAVELVDRVLVRDELEVARQLQTDLMPRAAPEVAGWSFAHAWRTANEVGGDYHNFTALADRRLAVMIGDASGHGMAAGLLMAIADATLQTAVEVDPTPVRVAELLHRRLLRTGDRRSFLSLFYALLEPTTGELEFICAGHPFPLLRRADGTIEELGSGSLPLGMSPALRLTPGKARIAPGDSLVLFTDGLFEALRAGEGESFGFDHLRHLIEPGGSAEGIHARIWTDFRVHAGDGALNDDVTLVVVARDRQFGNSGNSGTADSIQIGDS